MRTPDRPKAYLVWSYNRSEGYKRKRLKTGGKKEYQPRKVSMARKGT